MASEASGGGGGEGFGTKWAQKFCTPLYPLPARGRGIHRVCGSLMLNALIAAASFCRRAVARLGTVMGYVAGWGFIRTAAFIPFDVTARRFLGFSSQATTELTGYALAFGISWALTHALATRAHIRIDVLINHLPERL